MKWKPILILLLVVSPAIADDDKKADERKDKALSAVADMMFFRDAIRTSGYAMFAESATSNLVTQKRMLETHPSQARANPFPATASEEDRKAWVDKWLAPDPKTINDKPGPQTGSWTIALYRPGFNYGATCNPTGSEITLPHVDAPSILQDRAVESIVTAPATTNGWTEYFDDGAELWKLRRFSEGVVGPGPWQVKSPEVTTIEWRRKQIAALFYPFDALTFADPIHCDIRFGAEPLQIRFLHRFQYIGSEQGLRDQVITTWRHKGTGPHPHTNEITITLDPGFGGMPVVVEQNPYQREVNTYWHRTELSWRKFDAAGEAIWLPTEIRSERSDHQFGDTVTTENSVLHWVIGKNIPVEWFEADDLRAGILDHYEKPYAVGVPNASGFTILSVTDPIPIPMAFRN